MAKQINKAISLIFICITVSSCNSAHVSTATSANAVPVTEITIRQKPTATFAPFITQTVELTVGLTSLPVLSQQASERELKELLQNDSDCKSPCFLGVIPEQTTADELKNILNHFGLPLHEYKGKGNELLAYEIEQFPSSEVPPNTVFYLSNGLVKSTSIYLNRSNEFEWSMYSPSSMLKRFGTPSKVIFSLQGLLGPSGRFQRAYHMTFFYDDLDLIIFYGTPTISAGELITICPNKDDFHGAQIWLGNPSHSPSPDADGSLEDVTSFTLESFRDFLLLGPGACFNVDTNALPMYQG